MKLAGKEQQIIEKYNSGLSITKLAKEYSVVSSSILKLLRRNNIQTRDRVETRLIGQANYIKDLIGNLSGYKINIELKRKKYPVIYINRKDSQLILNKVGICPIECYKYKWNKVFNGEVSNA